MKKNLLLVLVMFGLFSFNVVGQKGDKKEKIKKSFFKYKTYKVNDKYVYFFEDYDQNNKYTEDYFKSLSTEVYVTFVPKQWEGDSPRIIYYYKIDGEIYKKEFVIYGTELNKKLINYKHLGTVTGTLFFTASLKDKSKHAFFWESYSRTLIEYYGGRGKKAFNKFIMYKYMKLIKR